MDYSAYQFIKAERYGRLLTLTLNNPPMNTISKGLHTELSRIFYDVQTDRDSDVVLITGSGDVFSAGGDIPLMQKRIDEPELCLPKNLEMKQIVGGILDLEKPVVCRINGDCVGFGLTGMRERVSLLRGDLEISSSPVGTIVAVAIPAP